MVVDNTQQHLLQFLIFIVGSVFWLRNSAGGDWFFPSPQDETAVYVSGGAAVLSLLLSSERTEKAGETVKEGEKMDRARFVHPRAGGGQHTAAP